MKEKNTNKKFIITIIVCILVLIILTTLCYGYYKKLTMNIQNPVVTMEVENFGTIKIELYPEIAPETVSNFIRLANNGFYDGSTFHRVVEDFMIQGGSTNGDGTGSAYLSDLYTNIDGEIDVDAYCELTGSTKKEYEELTKQIEEQNSDETSNESTDENSTNETTDSTSEDTEEATYIDEEYTIPGEFISNGYRQNNLNLTEGVLAVARSDYGSSTSTLLEASYNSGNAQFFIMTSNDYTSITGYYTGFGKVIEGMDVVKEVAQVEVKASDEEDETSEVSTPVEDVIITSVRVETYGVDYGLPETLEPFDYMSWLYSQYGLSY